MKIPFLFNRRYLAYEFNQKMDTNITEDDVQYSIESDIPQQQNTYDCGVYVCEYAEKITRNALITVKKGDNPKIRKRIRMEIKSVKLRNS